MYVWVIIQFLQSGAYLIVLKNEVLVRGHQSFEV